MIRTINGRRYVMRDQRPVRELRRLHAEFIAHFKSTLTFHQWLAECGKISLEIQEKGEHDGKI